MADTSSTTLPQMIDWAVTAALVLSGLLALMVGVVLYGAADRATIADLVAAGTIHSAMLTDTELIEVTAALASWSGIALLIVGGVLVVAGVAYAGYRHRTRPQDPTRTTWTNAVIGAAVTIFTMALPLSPVLGGAVAGYLEQGPGRDRFRVGALAGGVAAVPAAVIFVFLIGAFAVVATELSLGIGWTLGLAGFVIGGVVTVLYLIGLSAIGAYLTTHLEDDAG